MERADYLRQVVTRLAREIGVRTFQDLERLEETATYISDQFTSFGYQVARQPFVFNGNTYHNIIAELKGSASPERLLIVGAHYDAVRTTPGADDNASGVAGVLGLARERFCQADLQATATSQNSSSALTAPNQHATGITVQGPQIPANQPTIVIQNVQTQQGTPMMRQYKNPGLALALAIIFPGAGQFYNGHAGKGILVFFTCWLVIPYIWSWFDAYSCAKRINAVGF